eukprot:709978-Prymnesium_polylepis.1
MSGGGRRRSGVQRRRAAAAACLEATLLRPRPHQLRVLVVDVEKLLHVRHQIGVRIDLLRLDLPAPHAQGGGDQSKWGSCRGESTRFTKQL